jgi:hypothetical protein
MVKKVRQIPLQRGFGACAALTTEERVEVPKRVLVIRIGRLGDTILATPIIQAFPAFKGKVIAATGVGRTNTGTS